jgi:hypothetical protein
VSISSWPVGLAVSILFIAVTVLGRAVGVRPGRPFRVKLRQFWFGLAAFTIAYWGVVALLHR